jgi:hypothetical protein
MASRTNSSPRRRRLTPGFDVAKRPNDAGAETGDESDETKGLTAAGAWLRPRACVQARIFAEVDPRAIALHADAAHTAKQLKQVALG